MGVDSLELGIGRAALLESWRESPVHPIDPVWGRTLPDQGLPCGAVVEISSRANLGQATALALAACAGVQADTRLHGGDARWCAWVDAARTLYAPAVETSGVVLDRLLVVRPDGASLAKTAVRLTASRLFGIVVVDVSGQPGTGVEPSSLATWVNVVRKLSLAMQGADTTVLLLTDAAAARPLPLPVAMRLELELRHGKGVSVRIAKERHGKTGGPHTIALTRGDPRREVSRENPRTGVIPPWASRLTRSA